MMNDDKAYIKDLKNIPNMSILFVNSLPSQYIFKCFSYNLYKRLIEKQIYPLCKTKHKKTNVIFSTFIRTKKLENIVTEYTNDEESKNKYLNNKNKERC